MKRNSFLLSRHSLLSGTQNKQIKEMNSDDALCHQNWTHKRSPFDFAGAAKLSHLASEAIRGGGGETLGKLVNVNCSFTFHQKGFFLLNTEILVMLVFVLFVSIAVPFSFHSEREVV